MLGIVVTPNRTMYRQDFGKPLYESVAPVLDGYMEIVRAAFLPEPFRMLVNEEGRLKQLPLNEVGSAWYGSIIVGNIIIVKQEFTEDGPDIVGLTEKECLKVIGLISFMTKGAVRYVDMKGEEQ